MLLLQILLCVITSLFCVLQIMAVVPSIVAKPSEFAENFEKEDDEGFLHLQINEDVIEWVLFTIGSLIFTLRKRGYVKHKARKAAESGKYDNRFKKKSFQKIYDKAYLEQRKEEIRKKVEEDIKNNLNRTFFLNDKEKALYQNLYLEKITGKENGKNLVKERAEKMYEEIQLEPVENEVFTQLLSQER